MGIDFSSWKRLRENFKKSWNSKDFQLQLSSTNFSKAILFYGPPIQFSQRIRPACHIVPEPLWRDKVA